MESHLRQIWIPLQQLMKSAVVQREQRERPSPPLLSFPVQPLRAPYPPSQQSMKEISYTNALRSFVLQKDQYRILPPLTSFSSLKLWFGTTLFERIRMSEGTSNLLGTDPKLTE